MSTSRARFRRWTWASALLAALCAASLLLLGGRGTSAWDRTDATIPHENAHHDGNGDGNGDGWLNTKHNIESDEEGPVGREGCRSLLDPSVNNTRRPRSSPSFMVNLGVNFRARNCIDFYECDTGSVNWRYERSEWDEDHHHGSATGSTFLHQSTYTIELDGEAMLDGEGQVRKFNFDDTAVNTELTNACGGTTTPGTPPTTTTPGTPPERCPAGSTFEGRLVSELTYDANGDGRIDEDDCSATVPPPTTVPPTPTTTPTQTPPCPSSSERTGETVPPDEVKDENGEWLTGDALAAAIEDWCEDEPVPPKGAAPGATGKSASGVNQPSSCTAAGASATPDTVEVNVAAGGLVSLYPLRNDTQPTASAAAVVVFGRSGDGKFQIIDPPVEGRVVRTSLGKNAHNFKLTYLARPWASGRDQMIYQNPSGCQAIITFNITDVPPQVAFPARDRDGGEGTHRAGVSSVSASAGPTGNKVTGNYYARTSDPEQRDFEHRLWTTADGYDSSTYECSQTWSYRHLVESSVTTKVRVDRLAGADQPSFPSLEWNTEGMILTTYTHAGQSRYVQGVTGMHSHKNGAGEEVSHHHNDDDVLSWHKTDETKDEPGGGENHSIYDRHIFNKTVTTYSWKRVQETINWTESKYTPGEFAMEECSEPNKRVRTPGLIPNHITSSNTADINAPWVKLKTPQTQTVANAKACVRTTLSECIRKHFTGDWVSPSTLTNPPSSVKRHYYPGGDGSGGGGAQNFSFDNNPDDPNTDLRGHPRKSELLLTPDLPHYRTRWWMRPTGVAPWFSWWKRGQINVAGDGGEKDSCSSEKSHGRAPAPDTGSGAEVVCDPDGDLDLSTLQLLDDGADAALFAAATGLKLNPGDPGTPHWLVGMSDETMAFICDHRAGTSEWDAYGCFAQKRTGGSYQDLDETDGEAFEGDRRGDREPALNYDTDIEIGNSVNADGSSTGLQPSPYFQQPYAIDLVDEGDEARQCPWTKTADYWGSHTHQHDGEHHNVGHTHGSTPDTTNHTHSVFDPAGYPGSTGAIHPWQELFVELHPGGAANTTSTHHHHTGDYFGDLAWLGRLAYGAPWSSEHRCEFDGRRDDGRFDGRDGDAKFVGNVISETALEAVESTTESEFNDWRSARPADSSRPGPNRDTATSSVDAADAVVGEWVDGWRWNDDAFAWFNGDLSAGATQRRTTKATARGGYTVHILGTQKGVDVDLNGDGKIDDDDDRYIVVRYCVCDERFGAWKDANYPAGYHDGDGHGRNKITDYCTIFDMGYGDVGVPPPGGTPAI